MQELIKRAREIAYEENRKTGIPSKDHIDLSVELAVKLAKKLEANVEVVEVGSLIKDCLLGQALKEGRIQDHVQMSLEKTKDLLAEFDIEPSIKENILACVSEHHGVDKFHSIESEICCNADCYPFVSVKGLSYAMMNPPKNMEFPKFVELLSNKAKEKWDTLTLDVCKEELKPQYELITSFLRYLREAR